MEILEGDVRLVVFIGVRVGNGIHCLISFNPNIKEVFGQDTARNTDLCVVEKS